MTVAAYVSPSLVPAVIADTLVSFDDFEKAEIRVLPSTFSGGLNAESQKFASLARKIYFKDRMALAVSGKVSQIKDFIDDARGLYSAALTNERPMSVISKIANEYKQIAAVGVLSLDRGNNVLLHGERFQFQNLGDCWVVGSGRDELSLRLASWDQQFGSLDFSSVQGNLNALTCSLTNFNAVTEMYNNSAFRSWGGVYECGIFDFQAGRWRYGTSCLHITALAIETAFDTFTIALASRLMCYEPGTTHGMVKSIDSRSGDSVTWLLDDITDPYKGSGSDLDDIWRIWQPEMICITFLPPKGRTLKSPTMITHRTRVDGFKFECRDDFVMKIPDVEWDRLCTLVCDQWNVNYRPRYFEVGSIW
jgi:hypothetical protein